MIWVLRLLDKLKLIPPLIGILEQVKMERADGRWKKVKVKIDTGAYSTSIDKDLAQEMGWDLEGDGVERVYVRNVYGRQERRKIPIRFELKGKKVETMASLMDRSGMRFPMIVGRKDLVDFTILYHPENVKRERRLKVR